MKALMIDALGAGKGTRLLTRDVVGCGPRWICGILERNGVDCRIELCEAFLEREMGKIPADMDFLLASAMTMDLPALRKVGRLIRRTTMESLKVVGGPLCGDHERALRTSGFDIAVVGEAEGIMESILKGDDPAGIPGIAYREGSRIRVNNPGPRLDQGRYNEYIPSTERVIDYPTYFASRIYVEVVRGCSNFNRTSMTLSDGRRCTSCRDGCGLSECPEGIPAGCGFCSVPSTFGPPKSREVRSVEGEIASLVDLGVRRIVLSAPDILDYFRGDDLMDPSNPKPNYDKLGELLEASVAAAEGAHISIENVKPSLFDEEAARVIARNLPRSDVHIGCETGDERHSAELGRPSSPSQALRAVRMARKYGLKPYVYFIHGLPGQTIESARRTVKLIRRMEPLVEKITAYRFKPLPGSAFEREAPGRPRWDDEGSLMISKAAREVNLKKKNSLVGTLMDAVVAERNFQKRGEVICFPMEGGAIITIKGSVGLIGKRAKIMVTGAISERLLSGRLVEVLA